MARTFDLKLKFMDMSRIAEDLGNEIQADLQNMARTMAAATYNQGVQLAQKKLKSTLNTYLTSFKNDQVDDGTHIVHLLPGAMHLEEGYSSFDIKKGLLNGPKAKVGKNGIRYATVPFRIKTSSAATNLAEQLLATELTQGLKAGTNSKGEKTDLTKTQKAPNGAALQGTVGRISDPNVHRYLQGAVKIQKTYGQATQSQYMSFRTVSSNTPSNKWIHPGFIGIRLFDELEAWATSEVDRVLGRYLNS